MAFPLPRGGRLPGKAASPGSGALGGMAGWGLVLTVPRVSGNGSFCDGAVGLGGVSGIVGVRIKVSVLEYCKCF